MLFGYENELQLKPKSSVLLTNRKADHKCIRSQHGEKKTSPMQVRELLKLKKKKEKKKGRGELKPVSPHRQACIVLRIHGQSQLTTDVSYPPSTTK